MTNWTELFENLPDEEKDKLAVLRLVEVTNGCIQQLFRNNDPDALSVEDTRKAMRFSMSSIKRMQIVLDNETIDFAEPTKAIMADVRDYYIRGQKMAMMAPLLNLCVLPVPVWMPVVITV